ncbi:MAG: phosphorylase [Pedobacter sp.]|nr:MAG: phosphorylase [Pedobacter sp.]
MNKIAESDLILNEDGSIYHLNLHPEDIAPLVITVGDMDRVAEVSKHFDHIELKKGKREFITHTGTLGSKRITVISTGIGTDNIDIVFNELDALVNIDFETRTIKSKHTSLSIIRVGTSGAIQEDIPMGTILASTFGLGFDALMHFYEQTNNAEEQYLLNKIGTHFSQIAGLKPYLTQASSKLLAHFAPEFEKGITVTSPGFYAPQGRQVRAQNKVPNLIHELQSFSYKEHRITNLEMETAGIYALANALGHEALSVNAILASRVKLEFSQHPQKIVDKAIQEVLEKIATYQL